MKFNKELCRLALPEWRLYFIDYKRLKRCIKRVVMGETSEDAFWRLLDGELGKVSRFHALKRTWAHEQARCLSGALTEVEVTSPFTPNARRYMRRRGSGCSDVSHSSTDEELLVSTCVCDSASVAGDTRAAEDTRTTPTGGWGVARDLFGSSMSALPRSGSDSSCCAASPHHAAHPDNARRASHSSCEDAPLPTLTWIAGTANQGDEVRAVEVASVGPSARIGEYTPWRAAPACVAGLAIGASNACVSPLSAVAAASYPDTQRVAPRAVTTPVAGGMETQTHSPRVGRAHSRSCALGVTRKLVAPDVYNAEEAHRASVEEAQLRSPSCSSDNGGDDTEDEDDDDEREDDGDGDDFSPTESDAAGVAAHRHARAQQLHAREPDELSDCDSLEESDAHAAAASGATTLRRPSEDADPFAFSMCTSATTSAPLTSLSGSPVLDAARTRARGSSVRTGLVPECEDHAVLSPQRALRAASEVDAAQLSPMHAAQASPALPAGGGNPTAAPLTVATVTRRVTSQQLRFLRTRKAVADLQRELDLLAEYIRLNDRAVYKIVKKWDKRTGHAELANGYLQRLHASEHAFLTGADVREDIAAAAALEMRVRTIEPRAKVWKRTKAYTIGCFDAFHHGHANLLTALRQFGSTVIVGIHDDESYQLLKGELPVDALAKRVANVQPYVHRIFVITTTDPTPFMRAAVAPADVDARRCVYVRGDDMPNFPAREWVERVMDVYLLPRTEAVSSSFIKMMSKPGLEMQEALQIAFAPTDAAGKPVLAPCTGACPTVGAE